MRRVLMLMLMLTAVGCASAPPNVENAGAEAEIRRLDEMERTALLQQDVATLERLWAPQFIVNAPINRVSPNRAAVLDLVQRGAIRYTTFERRIEEFRLLGDIGIVMGAETVQPVGAEAGRPVQRRFTHVWQRHGSGWHLVARHANNSLPR